MLKPIIAVDIDEVLSPYIDGLIAWHNREYQTDYQWHDFHTYEFHKVWGGDRESAIRKGAAYFEGRGRIEPLTGAVRVLTRLKQDYELIVVTSRPLTHKPQTEAWIQEYFPGIFSAVLLCNHWNLDKTSPAVKKSTACLEQGAQYLIDDLPHYVEEAASTGIFGLLFGDYPWNKQVPQHPQIQRVAHWHAVENYFYR